MKFIPWTSNVPLSWGHLQHLDVLNLAEGFVCKVLKRKSPLDLGQ